MRSEAEVYLLVGQTPGDLLEIRLRFVAKIVERLKAIKYFRKKLHHRYVAEFYMRP